MAYMYYEYAYMFGHANGTHVDVSTGSDVMITRGHCRPRAAGSPGRNTTTLCAFWDTAFCMLLRGELRPVPTVAESGGSGISALLPKSVYCLRILYLKQLRSSRQTNIPRFMTLQVSGTLGTLITKRD
jgi:hypothetical protein